MVVSVREKELEAVATLDEAEIEQPEESQEVDLDRFYTVAEYMALPDGNDGKEYELVEGKLVEMQKGPSAGHGNIIIKLGRYLDTFVSEKNLGFVSSDIAFVIDPVNRPNTVRRPDVAYVNTESYDQDSAFIGRPDLAVEVVSPSDKWSDVIAKVAEYQAAKVPLVWVVELWTRTVQVYRLENGLLYQVVWPDAELDGENVLPGFKLKVSDIFATLPKK